MLSTAFACFACQISRKHDYSCIFILFKRTFFLPKPSFALCPTSSTSVAFNYWPTTCSISLFVVCPAASSYLPYYKLSRISWYFLSFSSTGSWRVLLLVNKWFVVVLKKNMPAQVHSLVRYWILIWLFFLLFTRINWINSELGCANTCWLANSQQGVSWDWWVVYRLRKMDFLIRVICFSR